MKYIIIVLVILYTTLDASTYIRSIRISSLTNAKVADKTLNKVKEFLYSHADILKLQKKYDFKFKIVKSNKYYIVALEPITNRQDLQKILDVLRKRYKSAYPKKLKVLPKVKRVIKEEALKEKKATVVANTLPIIEKKKVFLATAPKAIQSIKTDLNKNAKKLEEIVYKKTDSSSIAIDFFKKYSLYFETFFLLIILIELIYLILLKRSNNFLKSKSEMMAFDVVDKTRKLQAKEKLMSHVNHELRNPMSAVLNLSQLVLENELPIYQKENVESIEHAAQKALEIINDILDVSKINSGELNLESKEFNINSVIEHVLGTTYLQAKQNKVDIILDIDDTVPVNVISDSLRLGQVLINLLSNAIKFTKNGEIRLIIKKKKIKAQSIVLEFTISDNGIGMTPGELEQIFKSYNQGSSATARKFGGTGLGLTISKELIEKMGGKIKVRSQKDVGTTFVFTINVKMFDIDNKRNYHLPSSEYLNKKVLIVDSSNKNVIALLRAFRYFRYKTHVISDLDDELLKEKINFDIIVINQMQLSESAISKLQKMHFKNRVNSKIILTTDRYTKIDNEIMSKVDISGYLKMPFTQQNVLNVLIDIYGIKEPQAPTTINATKKMLAQMESKKILIAEDNVLNRKVITGLFANTGMNLTYAENGLEVINLIKKDSKFDLILIDIEMPIMDGYDATKEIRKYEENNSIPILALSANNNKEAADKAFAVGMQGYIQKPIILDDFYKKIYDALSNVIKINIDKNFNDEEIVSELSVIRGLEELNNKDNFYKSLLLDFKNIYLSSPQSFELLIQDEKFKEAIMLARDIRDVALNIGAYGICECVASLEYELEGKDFTGISKALNNYETHLLRLLDEIDIYMREK
ncbi:ATP-binding protein [Sulfurimonas sp.]